MAISGRDQGFLYQRDRRLRNGKPDEQRARYRGSQESAVHAIEEIRTTTLAKRIADAYVDGGAAAKAAITALGLQHIDPLHIFKFGLVGLWIFVVNLYGLSKKTFPTMLSIIGITGAIAYWLDLIGNVSQSVILVAIAAITAIILGPVWFIWIGTVIAKKANDSSGA